MFSRNIVIELGPETLKRVDTFLSLLNGFLGVREAYKIARQQKAKAAALKAALENDNAIRP